MDIKRVAVDSETIKKILLEKRNFIVEELVNKQIEAYPEIKKIYGEDNYLKNLLKEAYYYLLHLNQSISIKEPEIFSNYICLRKFSLESKNIPIKFLVDTLELLKIIFINLFEKKELKSLYIYISFALKKLDKTPSKIKSFISDGLYNEISKKYINYLLKLKKEKAYQVIFDAIDSGISTKDLYINVFQKTQYELGRLYQLNKITKEEEYYVTTSTQNLISIISKNDILEKKKNITIITTGISEDLHELGIKMVSDFFNLEGWKTFYLGINIPNKDIIEAVINKKANILAVSVTLPYHIENLIVLIKEIKSNEKLNHLKIIVGGYPFNSLPNLWKQINADGYAENAQKSIELVKSFII